VERHGDGRSGDVIVSAESEVFGPYQLSALLGRGATGEVWEAFDTRRERQVALKRLSGSFAADPEFRARFHQEARVTARLSSLHVVPIHDFGEIDGQLFVDMRLVDGGDLAHTVRTHPAGLGPERAVDVVTQIADALDSAHGAGLVHRDVKPSNVLLTDHRGRDFCYLVDFGIARLLGRTNSSLTSTGTVLGTTAYMAPELFSGAPARVQSDVYALACLFYEILTGHRPYSGPDPVAFMGQHVHGQVPVPSQGRADLAPFDRVLAVGMAKEADDRFASAGALADAAVEALQRAGAGAGPVAATSAVATAPGRLPESAPRTGSGDPRWAGPTTAPVAATGTSSGPSATRVGAPTLGRPPAPGDGSPARRGWRRPSRWIAVVIAAIVIVVGSVYGVDAFLAARSSGTGPTALAARQVPLPVPSPRWVDVSPDGRRAFVTGLGPGTPPTPQVTVMDTATSQVLAAIPVGTFPGDLAVSPDGTRLYVTERGTDAAPGNLLTIIDTATNTISTQVEVGLAPAGVALSPDGALAYVANEGTNGAAGNTVSVVDTAAAGVVATVPVGQGPSGVAVGAQGRKVYVANEGVRTGVGNTVSVIDTATNVVTGTVRVGDTPRGIAVRPDGQVAYVASQGTLQAPQGSVSVIDTATDAVTATITQDLGGPIGIAVTTDGRRALVTNYGSDPAPGSTVTAIDTADNSVVGTVAVGTHPLGVAGTPDGVHAYVTSRSELWFLDVPTG
jgi:YVTN family beta-propeller protein